MKTQLSIQEKLKDLRIECRLTLEELEAEVNISKSTLGSYESKDCKALVLVIHVHKANAWQQASVS